MNSKPKILVVGSFVMDLISSAPRVPNLGETVIGTSFQTAPGGKGTNQAVQCARLGADVTMVGAVGDDGFGKQLLDAARESGVNVDNVIIKKGVSSGVGNIQLEVTEDTVQNRIMVIPGANHDLSPSDVEWLRNEISEYDMVMMQLELTMETTEAVAKMAKDAGVPLMLNPAPAAELSDELLSCVTYLSPNEFEAALISGHPLKADENSVDEEDVKAVAGILMEKGVGKVIITLGGNGSAIASKDGLSRTPVVKMENVKDPTAAGDSFVAAFTTGLTSGMTEADALTFASHTAAITVTRMGAIPSLPTLDEVEALMKERGA